MENNPDMAACGHANWVINDDDTKTGRVFPVRKRDLYSKVDVILYGVPFLHSTLMYRRKFMVLDEPDREYFDWYIVAALSDHSNLGFISEEFGYYRLNPQSLTSTLERSLMTDRMQEMYYIHSEHWKDMRPYFGCVAILVWLAGVKNGRPAGFWNKKLLMRTFTLRSLPLLFTTNRVWKANARALNRG